MSPLINYINNIFNEQGLSSSIFKQKDDSGNIPLYYLTANQLTSDAHKRLFDMAIINQNSMNSQLLNENNDEITPFLNLIICSNIEGIKYVESLNLYHETFKQIVLNYSHEICIFGEYELINYLRKHIMQNITIMRIVRNIGENMVNTRFNCYELIDMNENLSWIQKNTIKAKFTVGL